jgi:hypothetical protein
VNALKFGERCHIPTPSQAGPDHRSGRCRDSTGAT